MFQRNRKSLTLEYFTKSENSFTSDSYDALILETPSKKA